MLFPNRTDGRSFMKIRILIVDDDAAFTRDLAALLGSRYHVSIENSAARAEQSLKEADPDVVLLDLMLDNGHSGLDLISAFKAWSPLLPIIMITDYSSVDTAIEAMKRGATDYISKTPNISELEYLLERATQTVRREQERDIINHEVKQPYSHFIGNSPAMNRLRERIRLTALNLNTVLITGESGVGKELVARQLHYASDRRDHPFVAINCAAIPSELLESELFGYEKGAFTGAQKRKLGKFELASDGVLFLDEISELSPEAQVKLLRVIQEREFTRVGGNENVRTGAKIIAATNRNLVELVQARRFREDLYYRLDVIPLDVAPLRQRKDDIPDLARHFLREICAEMKVPQKEFSDDSLQRLLSFDWPGNVRQLKNYIIRAAILCTDNLITPEFIDVPQIAPSPAETSIPVAGPVPSSWAEMDEMRRQAMSDAGREVEKRYIEQLLKEFNGNVSQAAAHAGINRSNLHKMIRRCGIQEP